MASQPQPEPLNLTTTANVTPTRETLSPTSPSSPQSPTERSFFGAITSVTNRARSRSRSKLTRNRSRSPLPRTPMASPTEEARPAPQRYSTTLSQASTAYSRDTPIKRQSTDSSEWERLTYGRHSTDWLFNGFSFTDTAKEAVYHLSRRGTDRSSN